MNTTQTLAVRFTAKRASYWNHANKRWQAIGRDRATLLIATGQAEEISAEDSW